MLTTESQLIEHDFLISFLNFESITVIHFITTQVSCGCTAILPYKVYQAILCYIEAESNVYSEKNEDWLQRINTTL